jgi:hypothetical protein
MEIVGVAKNAHYGELRREIPPVIYIPYNQGYPLPNEMTFALRTTGDPLGYVNAVREIVHAADAGLPVAEVRTQSADITDKMREETVLAELCSAFAVLALTIACVGLYGTISHTVARRTGEIGIRIALGAERGPVLWMVLREVLILVIGLAISVLALGKRRSLSSPSYSNEAERSLALGLAVMILLLAARPGVYWHGGRPDHPVTALRHE